ncbi:carboxypeptidase-like regulatory domain-containing protein, partial [uncultured Muribaculum sp.]
MPVIRITLLIVSILSGAFCCFPQTRIHGRVTDERNHPIEFATVRVAGTSVGVNTDAEGRYRLTAPAADTLHILFSCIGYRDGERKLVKVRGNDLAVNMKLKKASRQLREVQISEYKKQ